MAITDQMKKKMKKKKKEGIPEMHHPAKNNTTRPILNNQNLFYLLNQPVVNN